MLLCPLTSAKRNHRGYKNNLLYQFQIHYNLQLGVGLPPNTQYSQM